MTRLVPLDNLAERINAEHDAAHAAARSAIEHAIECGRLLIEAKAQVAHGEWLPWTKRNLAFGERQARKYMRVAEHAETLIEANRTSDADLTIDGALKLLTAPKEEPAPAPPPPSPKHPLRDKTPEQWAEWSGRIPVDREAMVLLLHVEGRRPEEIAAQLGLSDAQAAARIYPTLTVRWLANPDDSRDLNDRFAVALPALAEAVMLGDRVHALEHAEGIARYERRDDLVTALDIMRREAGGRGLRAQARATEVLADFPRDLAAAVFDAAGWPVLYARGEFPDRPVALWWVHVGIPLLMGTSQAANAFAERYASAKCRREFKDVATQLRDATEVLLDCWDAFYPKAGPASGP